MTADKLEMFVKEMIRKALKPLKSWLAGDTRSVILQNYQLLGRMASWQLPIAACDFFASGRRIQSEFTVGRRRNYRLAD